MRHQLAPLDVKQTVPTSDDGAAVAIVEPCRLIVIARQEAERRQCVEHIIYLVPVRAPWLELEPVRRPVEGVLSEVVEQTPHVPRFSFAPVRRAPGPPATAPMAEL